MEKLTYAEQAQVLSEALPYIRAYNQKIVVVKYGGNAMVSPTLKQTVMGDLVLLSLVGIRPVLVHGGGPEISAALKQMGIESRFVGGLRYTDEATLRVVQMVLSGRTNKDLVNLLGQQGGRALGLCGIDGRMLQAKKLEGPEDLGYVGQVTGVDTKLIHNALKMGYIPVIATLGVGEDGTVYNINADSAAASIAAALKAEDLISMTDVRGLLSNPEEEDSVIPVVELAEVPGLIQRGIITGGMIPKVNCCVDAVKGGVQRAFIIDGRIPHSILIELMTDAGIGTMFLKGGTAACA